jgi:hypothetical protein
MCWSGLRISDAVRGFVYELIEGDIVSFGMRELIPVLLGDRSGSQTDSEILPIFSV